MSKTKTEKTIEVIARFDADKKNFHRFKIESDSDQVVGTIYIRKSTPVPEAVVVVLKNKSEK